MDPQPKIEEPGVQRAKKSSVTAYAVFTFGVLLVVYGVYGIIAGDGWNFLGFIPLVLGSIVCLVYVSAFPEGVQRWVRMLIMGLFGFAAITVLALMVFTIFSIAKGS